MTDHRRRTAAIVLVVILSACGQSADQTAAPSTSSATYATRVIQTTTSTTAAQTTTSAAIVQTKQTDDDAILAAVQTVLRLYDRPDGQRDDDIRDVQDVLPQEMAQWIDIILERPDRIWRGCAANMLAYEYNIWISYDRQTGEPRDGWQTLFDEMLTEPRPDLDAMSVDDDGLRPAACDTYAWYS